MFARLIQTSPEQARQIADALVEGGVFRPTEIVECAGEECGIELSTGSIEAGECPHCGADLAELPPQTVVRFHLDRGRSRDLGWLIALHGIRTHGAWQEQLQWLVDREYRRTVPFRNWKYGSILIGSLVPPLQRRLVDRFVGDLRSSTRELEGLLGPETPPPDVVAHSFGTWIVTHALEHAPDIRLGRLVLIGSIVRPDWNWALPLGRGQLTGVLNYCGDRDPWVRAAERFIPDSGPSGRVGFAQAHDRVVNLLSPGGGHSSAFAEDRLIATFDEAWRPFLSGRLEDIDSMNHRLLPSFNWRRAPWFLRAPWLLVLAGALAVSLGLTVSVFGF
jgi:pimeloyl-ACP methyl ester carboxylesterase